tara:strand:+ start:494 stop:1378 length:885 start_codon:yes stop_codon:yes gene_type:complete
MSIVLHDFATEDWPTIRPQYSLGPFIGGSETSSIDGTNSFTSGYTLLRRKRGLEEFPDLGDVLSVQRGNTLEPVVLDELAGILDTNILKPNKLLLHEDFPWAIANFDGVTDDEWIVEVKTTSSYPMIEQAKSGEIPAQYLSQGDHYLSFTQFEGCPNPGKFFKGIVYAVLHQIHQPLIILKVTREERLDNIITLMQKESAFIDLFKNKEMPEPDGHSSTSRSLRAQYDTGRQSIPAENQHEILRETHKDASTKIKELEKIKTQAANQLRASMGDDIQRIAGICSIDKRNILRVK